MSQKRKEREHLMRVHGHKYKRHFITEGYYCFYCGQSADTLDHVPPLSLMDIYTQETRKKKRIPATLVPCCSECNSALSNRNLPTVMDRLMYLESYYEAYFKKQKAQWTEEEIEELGSSLREYVRHKQDKLNVYKDKIRAIQLRSIKDETHPIWVPDEEIEN